MNIRKRHLSLVLIFSLALSFWSLSACQSWRMKIKNFEQNFVGLSMTLHSYDENSRVIDSLHGNNVSIRRNTTFDSSEESGDSPVVTVSIGKHELTHVGSSLILYEDGLENLFETFDQHVHVDNLDRSIPIINRLAHDFANKFTGRQKIILIRSQNGSPLATFAGKKVSLDKTDVPKSTALLIDGRYLFIYRCDYTIYDSELFDK
ncbi:MAG: DUF5052 family protein [Eubacteriales bacterium]|nr:DUF5052 family protein [Eubacteriales bacterium]